MISSIPCEHRFISLYSPVSFALHFFVFHIKNNIPAGSGPRPYLKCYGYLLFELATKKFYVNNKTLINKMCKK